jgi:hypothetical protein
LGELAFDGDGEFGEVAVADDLAKLAFGLQDAGGCPAQAMSPDCQRFTLRLVPWAHSIIDSHGLVLLSVCLSDPVTPSRVTGSVSAIPSRGEEAAPGWLRSTSLASA